MARSARVTTSTDEGASPATGATVATCEGPELIGDCSSSMSLDAGAGAGAGPVASADDDSASAGCGAGAIDGGTSDNLAASASTSAAGEGIISVSAALAIFGTCGAAAVGRCASRGLRALDSFLFVLF